ALWLREVCSASISGSFAHSEWLAGRTQHIFDIREAFRRFDQPERHNLRIVCLRIRDMRFRIVTGSRPIGPATRSTQRQRSQWSTDFAEDRRIEHWPDLEAFNQLRRLRAERRCEVD